MTPNRNVDDAGYIFITASISFVVDIEALFTTGPTIQPQFLKCGDLTISLIPGDLAQVFAPTPEPLPIQIFFEPVEGWIDNDGSSSSSQQSVPLPKWSIQTNWTRYDPWSTIPVSMPPPTTTTTTTTTSNGPTPIPPRSSPHTYYKISFNLDLHGPNPYTHPNAYNNNQIMIKLTPPCTYDLDATGTPTINPITLTQFIPIERWFRDAEGTFNRGNGGKEGGKMEPNYIDGNTLIDIPYNPIAWDFAIVGTQSPLIVQFWYTGVGLGSSELSLRQQQQLTEVNLNIARFYQFDIESSSTTPTSDVDIELICRDKDWKLISECYPRDIKSTPTTISFKISNTTSTPTTAQAQTHAHTHVGAAKQSIPTFVQATFYHKSAQTTRFQQQQSSFQSQQSPQSQSTMPTADPQPKPISLVPKTFQPISGLAPTSTTIVNLIASIGITTTPQTTTTTQTLHVADRGITFNLGSDPNSILTALGSSQRPGPTPQPKSNRRIIILLSLLALLLIPLLYIIYRLWRGARDIEREERQVDFEQKEALLMEHFEAREEQLNVVIRTMGKALADQAPPEYIPELDEVPRYDGDDEDGGVTTTTTTTTTNSKAKSNNNNLDDFLNTNPSSSIPRVNSLLNQLPQYDEGWTVDNDQQNSTSIQ